MSPPLPPAIAALLDSGAVDTLLRTAGRDAVDPSTARVLSGRNNNFSVYTRAGDPLFVKQFELPSDAAVATTATNLAQTLAFERYREAHHQTLAGLGAPELVAADEAAALVIYTLIPDVLSLAEVADTGDLTARHLHDVGAALGALHAGPVTEQVPTVRHRLPPSGAFVAINQLSWAMASAAELEAWALLQSDQGLIDGVTELRRREDTGDNATPIHGDLRLDQVLVSPTAVHVTDFEDFRVGDPARDLGSLLGELAYRAILGIIKDTDASFTLDVEFTHEEIVERGARELDITIPLLTALWAGYRTVPGRADPTLGERSVAWLGWHMFDRLLASSKDRNKLLSVHRAAAGIGRAVLLTPARYVETFGLVG